MTIDCSYRDLPATLADLEAEGLRVLVLIVRRREATYRLHVAPMRMRQETMEPVLQGRGDTPRKVCRSETPNHHLNK